MGWSPSDRDALLKRVAASPGATSAPGLVSRRKQQNFTHIGHYLSERTWAEIASYKGLAMDISDASVVALGLRTPTEPTIQKLTACLVLCMEGQAPAMAMQPAYLHEFSK